MAVGAWVAGMELESGWELQRAGAWRSGESKMRRKLEAAEAARAEQSRYVEALETEMQSMQQQLQDASRALARRP